MMKNAYRIFVFKFLKEGDHSEDTGIDERTDIREVGWGGGGVIHLIEDRDLWRALVSTANNPRVQSKMGHLKTSWAYFAHLTKDSVPWSLKMRHHAIQKIWNVVVFPPRFMSAINELMRSEQSQNTNYELRASFGMQKQKTSLALLPASSRVRCELRELSVSFKSLFYDKDLYFYSNDSLLE